MVTKQYDISAINGRAQDAIFLLFDRLGFSPTILDDEQIEIAINDDDDNLILELLQAGDLINEN